MRSGEARNDYSCFGNYGARVMCKGCRNEGTCKILTYAGRKSTHIRYKGKHKGRGRWTRKDLY